MSVVVTSGGGTDYEITSMFLFWLKCAFNISAIRMSYLHSSSKTEKLIRAGETLRSHIYQYFALPHGQYYCPGKGRV